MVGVGRRPNTSALNLAAAGITPGPRGELQVNEHMQTSVPGDIRGGDVLARFMLSSMAVVEARIAAENALGMSSRWTTPAPLGIYTDPEVGSVGFTEDWALAGGGEVVIGRCGYSDLVRSCLDANITGSSSSSSIAGRTGWSAPTSPDRMPRRSFTSPPWLSNWPPGGGHQDIGL